MFKDLYELTYIEQQIRYVHWDIEIKYFILFAHVTGSCPMVQNTKTELSQPEPQKL